MAKREQLLNEIRLAKESVLAHMKALDKFDKDVFNNVFPTKTAAIEAIYNKLMERAESDIDGCVRGEDSYSQAFIVDSVVYESTLFVEYSSTYGRVYVARAELFFKLYGNSEPPTLVKRVGGGVNPCYNYTLKEITEVLEA